MKRFLLMIPVLWLCLQAVGAQNETHPRLWITATSLEQYRQWAANGGPFYTESLLPAAEQGKADMDAGVLESGDLGSNAYEDYVTENYAALFAFMSLVHPDVAQREDYAQRSRTLLMHVITIAAQGPAEGEPFRDPAFSINDRSRWYGVNFALTVDWIYPTLTADDKALIRQVFLRWMGELTVAETTTMNHPQPLGVLNNPILVSEVDRVRWAGNNYYTAHMRNMGMMALAFDPADDPDRALKAYIDQSIGSWLYIHDHLTRTEAAGGFGTEGFEYSPQSVGYAAEFMLALYTAGYDDPALYGQQVTFAGNPFWDDTVKAYAHSLSPTTVIREDYGETVYQPAWYGSGQDYLTPDFIELFGPLGVYDALTNNAERLNAVRWLQMHTGMGGAEDVVGRSNDPSELHKTILYFMLFDPTAPAPTDPRPSYPTTWYAPGMRRLLSRTDWTENAAWFTYNLSWDRVDHNAAGGNGIEFYRNGEWLTKIHVGYDLDYIASDHLNTLGVQNDPVSQDDYRLMLWERGSQWLYSANDPVPPVYSEGPDYLFVYGDSTNLYNTDYEGLDGVLHVSRSVLWLKPDVVIIYDRAITRSDNRLKRFNLNLQYEATAGGSTTVMNTPKGQTLFINTLLPVGAVPRVSPWAEEPSGPAAHYEPMAYHFEVDSENKAEERFLHVLQMGDSPTRLVTVADGLYEGVALGPILALFPTHTDAPVNALTYEVSAVLRTHIITGLTPNTAYDVKFTYNGNMMTVTIAPGTSVLSDGAGVLLTQAE